MTRAPSLISVVRKHTDSRLADLHVALPARIESFDPSTQLARVKPLLRETVETEEGDEAVEALPVISNVPVQFPGGGGYVLTFPVAIGDPCLLVFADRALDRWIESGGDVDPVDLRRHNLSDAVAILGVRHRSAAKALAVEIDGAALGEAAGVRVRVTGGQVHLGVDAHETATEAALRGTTFRSRQATMHEALRTAAAALATAGGTPAAATTFATAVVEALVAFELGADEVTLSDTVRVR